MSPSWLQLHRDPAPRLPVVDTLGKMLRVAVLIRKCFSEVGEPGPKLQAGVHEAEGIRRLAVDFQSVADIAEALFCPASVDSRGKKIVETVLAFRSANNFSWTLPGAHVNAAVLICQALYGPDSTLWALLLYLNGLAQMGCRVAVVNGPAGAGKNFTITAFVSLQFLVSSSPSALFCAANEPPMHISWICCGTG